MDKRFILLHYTTKEDWWVRAEDINVIRYNHDKENSNDNGTWVYLIADNIPIKVMETPEEIFQIIKSVER